MCIKCLATSQSLMVVDHRGNICYATSQLATMLVSGAAGPRDHRSSPLGRSKWS